MTSNKPANRATLKASWRILILISANLADGRYAEIAKLFDIAREKRMPVVRIYEIILQSYLFLGYPKAIEGLRLLEQHFPKFIPPPADGISSKSLRLWHRRGEALCRRTYDSNYERLRERMQAISPDLDRWMVWEGYGKVLSRSGVPPVVRELCTCAALVVTGDIVQLHSHMRGAINAGASTRMLSEMISLLHGTAKASRQRKASKLLHRMIRKADQHA